MATMSELYGPRTTQIGEGQYTALTGKKPNIPLSTIIHAQIPGFKIAREAQSERELAEEMHEEEMKMKEKEIEEAAEQSERATAIQGTGIASGLGYLGGKEFAALSEIAPFGSTIGFGGAAALEFARDPLEEWAEEQAGGGAETAMHIAVRAGQGTVIGGPIGAGIGAGIGVLEEVAEATMLCTELHRQGLLPDEIYQADYDYAKKIPVEIKIGYRIWARHLVPVMAKSKLFTKIIGVFIRAWAYHMAYKMGVVSERNRLGAFIETAGMPICKIIGNIVLKERQNVNFG